MSNISAIIPAHDEQLPDDILTTLTINYRWRRIIAPLLWPLAFDAFWSGTATQRDDAKNKALDLIIDLYDTETTLTNYHGALVARIADHTVTTSDIGIPFATTTGNGLHDTDGYFDISSPNRLTIPAGLGGFYAIHAGYNVLQAANTITLWINKLGPLVRLDDHFIVDVAVNKARQMTVANLAAGDAVSLSASVDSGTRAIVKGSQPWSVTFGMFRIGL